MQKRPKYFTSFFYVVQAIGSLGNEKNAIVQDSPIIEQQSIVCPIITYVYYDYLFKHILKIEHYFHHTTVYRILLRVVIITTCFFQKISVLIAKLQNHHHHHHLSNSCSRQHLAALACVIIDILEFSARTWTQTFNTSITSTAWKLHCPLSHRGSNQCKYFIVSFLISHFNMTFLHDK